MAAIQTISRPQPGSTRRRVFDLAWPAVGEQLLNTAVGLTDVFLVGNLSSRAATQLGYTSAVALASTGLANHTIWLITIMFMAVAIGSTALIARATGAGDQARVQNILRQSMIIALTIGLIAVALAIPLTRPFLTLLGAPSETLSLSERFMRIVAPSFLPAALLFVGMACLRGVGDTRTPLFIMLGVNGANIIVSWLLINGNLGLPALGVDGAAIGTAIARGAGGFVVIGLLLRGHFGLRLTANLRPDGAILRRILDIGLPSAGEQMVFQLALLVFTRFVTGLGAVTYAAHNVTITIESISFLPGMGYAAAASTLVGQALGARSPRQAEDFAYEALWQGGLMMSLAGLMMVLFPEPILSAFTNDPMVVAAAAGPLRAAGLVQPALAVSFILLGSLRGAGDTRWPLLSRLITAWLIRLPLTFVLVGWLEMGLAGIWLAMCIDFTCQALLALWRFGSGRWKRIEM
jgi:putative MATE family efflux protein